MIDKNDDYSVILSQRFKQQTIKRKLNQHLKSIGNSPKREKTYILNLKQKTIGLFQPQITKQIQPISEFNQKQKFQEIIVNSKHLQELPQLQQQRTPSTKFDNKLNRRTYSIFFKKQKVLPMHSIQQFRSQIIINGFLKREEKITELLKTNTETLFSNTKINERNSFTQQKAKLETKSLLFNIKGSPQHKEIHPNKEIDVRLSTEFNNNQSVYEQKNQKPINNTSRVYLNQYINILNRIRENREMLTRSKSNNYFT